MTECTVSSAATSSSISTRTADPAMPADASLSSRGSRAPLGRVAAQRCQLEDYSTFGHIDRATLGGPAITAVLAVAADRASSSFFSRSAVTASSPGASGLLIAAVSVARAGRALLPIGARAAGTANCAGFASAAITAVAADRRVIGKG